MREWRVMLGPFLIWATHFGGVYVLASVADLTDPSAGLGLRVIGLVGTALCGLALAIQFVRSRRPAGVTPLARRLAGVGFATGLIAITWQSLPLAISG